MSEVSKAKTLTIAVEADTSILQLKLKAIARHAEALADELDSIDKAHDTEYMDAEQEG